MKLYAQELFFRGDSGNEKVYDCCVHGKIVFKIGENVLSDDNEWCISASAYRFLHSLFENHFMGAEEFLIPCCGHTLIPDKDKKTVDIIGCNNGIDFNIIHEQGNIIVVTESNTEYYVSFAEYKNAVLSLAKQIMDFYQSNPPREFLDDFEKDGYSAFVTEWYSLYDKAVALGDNISKINELLLDDYDVCTEDEIIGISKEGISLKSFRYINFRECAYNFKIMESSSGTCVGKRNVADLSFVFYTSKKPTMIKFLEKNRIIEFMSKQNTVFRFHKLQKQIEEYGYSTRDMT